jgi:hypothetical protein
MQGVSFYLNLLSGKACYSNSDSRSCVEVRDRSGQRSRSQNGQSPSMPATTAMTSIMLHRIGSVRLEYAALLGCNLSLEAVGISLAYVRALVSFIGLHTGCFMMAWSPARRPNLFQVRPHLQNTPRFFQASPSTPSRNLVSVSPSLRALFPFSYLPIICESLGAPNYLVMWLSWHPKQAPLQEGLGVERCSLCALG